MVSSIPISCAKMPSGIPLMAKNTQMSRLRTCGRYQTCCWCQIRRSPLIQDSIKGLSEYAAGTNKDFSAVGVKALDDHTVQYTLNKPETYWNSKTTSGVMMPVNEAFLESKARNSVRQPRQIPFCITVHLSWNPLLLNPLSNLRWTPNYWDKDKVKIDGVKLSYYDGSDQDSLARTFGDGG